MIIFNKPIKLPLVLNYNYKFKKGFVAKIDQMTSYNNCGSNIMCRIINIRKKPLWLDLGWFGEPNYNDILKEKDII